MPNSKGLTYILFLLVLYFHVYINVCGRNLILWLSWSLIQNTQFSNLLFSSIEVVTNISLSELRYRSFISMTWSVKYNFLITEAQTSLYLVFISVWNLLTTKEKGMKVQCMIMKLTFSKRLIKMTTWPSWWTKLSFELSFSTRV